MRNQWTPVAVEDNTDGEFDVLADGTLRLSVDLYLTERQYDEMKQGYRCCRCFGLVDSAFPETCGFPGCDGYPKGFPMRERQREVMDSEMTDDVRRAPKRETSPYIWTPGSERN